MLLKNYLKLYDISKKSFSDTLGVTPQTIYKFCSGARKPSKGLRIAIQQISDGHVHPEDFDRDQTISTIQSMKEDVATY